MTHTLDRPSDQLDRVLTERLDAQALAGLRELSSGNDDFVLYMLRQLELLLSSACPKMEAHWRGRDFRALALDVHRLRASVGYTGARRLAELVDRCEPMLRKHSGAFSAADQRAEETALETMTEAQSLLKWLRTVLPPQPNTPTPVGATC